MAGLFDVKKAPGIGGRLLYARNRSELKRIEGMPNLDTPGQRARKKGSSVDPYGKRTTG